MPALSIIFQEPAWPDLADKPVGEVINVMDDISVAALDSGMLSGKPSVAFRMTLPDGKTVIAQTSARLFCGAARAIMGRYPDLFED